MEHPSFFAKLPTDKPIQRGAWDFEVDETYFRLPGAPAPPQPARKSMEAELKRCNLRTDWQTLRRLPLTGAIVFNFKAVFTPLESFRDEPFIPAMALKMMMDVKPSILQYKAKYGAVWHVENVMKPALRAWAQEQIDRGWVPADWKPETLPEAPFFPNWHKKWTSQQGFP